MASPPRDADRLPESPDAHVMLWGGTRSGKSTDILRVVMGRFVRATGKPAKTTRPST
jgi:hypothetical protein